MLDLLDVVYEFPSYYPAFPLSGRVVMFLPSFAASMLGTGSVSSFTIMCMEPLSLKIRIFKVNMGKIWFPSCRIPLLL